MNEMKTPGLQTRRRWLWGALVGGCALGAGAFSGCVAWVPREIDVSEAQILAALNQNMPYRRKLLEVIDLQLDRPRLAMLADRNRVGLQLDLRGEETLFTRRTFEGVLGLTSALRYESGDGTIRLQDVQLEKLNLQGLSEAQSARLTKAVAWWAEQQLEGQVVRRIAREQLDRAAMAGVRPGALTVRPGGVTMSLEAIRP